MANRKTSEVTNGSLYQEIRRANDSEVKYQRLYPDIQHLLFTPECTSGESLMSNDSMTSRMDSEKHEYKPDGLREEGSSLSKKRSRRAKKVFGWVFVIGLFPVALLFNGIREQPNDRNDPYDIHDDPLRPWHYKVDIEKYVK